jgi:methylated-DNA-[protein]-cysteine S-methyltransferase
MPGAQEHGGLAVPAEVERVRVLLPSPIGPLGIELRGLAVTRLRIDPPEPERASFTPFHQLDGSDLLDEVFGRLAEYFAGARRRLDLEFDLSASGLDGFARRVLKEAAKIPYAKTRSYRTSADASGRPDAYRQVLTILIENPIPIVIPCHRVITTKSGIGSYIGGCDRKRWLLDLEQSASEPL